MGDGLCPLGDGRRESDGHQGQNKSQEGDTCHCGNRLGKVDDFRLRPGGLVEPYVGLL